MTFETTITAHSVATTMTTLLSRFVFQFFNSTDNKKINRNRSFTIRPERLSFLKILPLPSCESCEIGGITNTSRTIHLKPCKVVAQFIVMIALSSKRAHYIVKMLTARDGFFTSSCLQSYISVGSYLFSLVKILLLQLLVRT